MSYRGPMARRDDVLTAVVSALGEHGLYGLTHRKVDRAGALPEGTTSNYFRTRAQLLSGAVEHLVAGDLQAWETMGADEITTTDDLVDIAAAFVAWAVGDGRPRSSAQIALLEAAITNPEVSEVLTRARKVIEHRANQLCSPLGLDRTQVAILLDATDAIIFRQLAMPESTIGFDPRRYFSALLNTLTR